MFPLCVFVLICKFCLRSQRSNETRKCAKFAATDETMLFFHCLLCPALRWGIKISTHTLRYYNTYIHIYIHFHIQTHSHSCIEHDVSILNVFVAQSFWFRTAIKSFCIIWYFRLKMAFLVYASIFCLAALNSPTFVRSAQQLLVRLAKIHREINEMGLQPLQPAGAPLCLFPTLCI